MRLCFGGLRTSCTDRYLGRVVILLSPLKSASLPNFSDLFSLSSHSPILNPSWRWFTSWEMLHLKVYTVLASTAVSSDSSQVKLVSRSIPNRSFTVFPD